ncbi:membrane protein [Polymorphobacter multimanifer]|uniref:5-oxoproline transporter, DUF979 family subunit n=1 Tax=Polymorphobacter multimanifer TaxID=1070431 RepID=UPI001668D59D|nr:DUF979 family protein [Polymorphobacter multimanifer]GGI89344.1 membrane protein [Polymorphobacter multimanifer]
MIGLPALYTLAGLLFAGWGLMVVFDRSHPGRSGSTLFWGLIALSFLAGDLLGDVANGVLVVALVVLAAMGFPKRGLAGEVPLAERRASAARLGNRLIGAALIVPATALIGTLLLPQLAFVDPKQVTLLSLGLGAVIATVVLLRWLRLAPVHALGEGKRLVDGIGWALLLPQLLASLGAVFALAGIGEIIGDGVAGAIPQGARLPAVLAFTLGMAGFTIIMGNAFAAFPVMMAAVGLPILILGLGASPVVVGAVGMLSGFCGTLLSPMAANFNIVPAVLLDLDRSAVIRAQMLTALPLFVFNTAIIWGFGFP